MTDVEQLAGSDNVAAGAMVIIVWVGFLEIADNVSYSNDSLYLEADVEQLAGGDNGTDVAKYSIVSRAHGAKKRECVKRSDAIRCQIKGRKD